MGTFEAGLSVFCMMRQLQSQGGQRVKCHGLNEIGPHAHKFEHLMQAGGTIREELEMCLRARLKAIKELCLFPVCSLSPTHSVEWELSAMFLPCLHSTIRDSNPLEL